MGECVICTGDDKLTFTCNHCDQKFCADHRLPECHDCGVAIQRSSTTNPSRQPPGQPDSTVGSTTDWGDKSPDTALDGSLVQQESDTNDAVDSSTSWLDALLFPVHRLVAVVQMLSTGAKYVGKYTKWFLPLHMLNMYFVVFVAIIAVVYAGSAVGVYDDPMDIAGHSPADTSRLNEKQIERQIHDAVNDRRQSAGKSKLGYDKTLHRIADLHSEDMANRAYFSHTSPDGNNFGDRYDESDYDCRVAMGNNMYSTGGENIAYTYADSPVVGPDGNTIDHDNNETSIARGIVRSWINSPGHRENLLKSYWNVEGIGVATAATEDGLRVYATQNFC